MNITDIFDDLNYGNAQENISHVINDKLLINFNLI